VRTFRCNCGNRLFFENYHCLQCKRDLGFIVELRQLVSLQPTADHYYLPVTAKPGSTTTYKKCINYQREKVCNWMLPADSVEQHCLSCRLNRLLPDLDKPNNRLYWARFEHAKRYLIYGLLQLQLPLIDRQHDPLHGLCFDFLADRTMGEDHVEQVLTGHSSGLITINMAEADHVAREEARVKMGEPYRTLLGHLRHESGHYYWAHLVNDTPWIAPFRQLFGDERQDYSQALRTHYQHGCPPHWQQDFISAYASAHPWEDWAETWAHYLHMRDTLETCYDFEVMPENADIPEIANLPPGNMQGYNLFSAMLHDWSKLSVLLNGLNRSMGLSDAYPFVLSKQATQKLKFVHQVICAYYRRPNRQAQASLSSALA